jgi:hypothetical protein
MAGHKFLRVVTFGSTCYLPQRHFPDISGQYVVPALVDNIYS